LLQGILLWVHELLLLLILRMMETLSLNAQAVDLVDGFGKYL
jgi:hypothetical protein